MNYTHSRYSDPQSKHAADITSKLKTLKIVAKIVIIIIMLYFNWVSKLRTT